MNEKELLRQYQKGEKNFFRFELSKANLKGESLRDVQLSYASLYQADLSKANLFKTILIGAVLIEAILQETMLSEAVLIWANLHKANLILADLSYAVLSEADLTGAILHEADLRQADLRGANLSEARISNTKLYGAFYNEHTQFPNNLDFTKAEMLLSKIPLQEQPEFTKIDTDQRHLVQDRIALSVLQVSLQKQQPEFIKIDTEQKHLVQDRIASSASQIPLQEQQPEFTKIDTEQGHLAQNSVASISRSLVSPEGSRISYIKLLRQSAIVGSGSYLVVLALASLIGTVWINAGFWLISLGIIIFVIFGFFAKNKLVNDNLFVVIIAVISSAIPFLLLPQFFKTLQQGLIIKFLLTIFAGVLAFIIINLYENLKK